MRQLKYRITILFAVLVGCYLLLSVWHSPIDLLNHQENVLFRAGEDFQADFFNVQRYISENDPYFNEINGPSEKPYLPLCYLILKPFNHVCDYAHMSLEDCWHSPLAQLSAILFLLISLFFFFHSFLQLNRNKEWKTYHTFLLLFSSIFLFTIERGNLIILTVAFINYFLAYYDSKNVWKYRVGLLCLCLAAVMKIYPVLLGLLLLKDKRYKDIALCASMGMILTFVPFLFFQHGFANVPRLFENIQANVEIYKASSHEYKFGIPALGQMAISAINDSSAGTLPGKSVACTMTILKIVSALLTIASLVLVFFEKRRWLQVALISMVLLMYPVNSGFYCGLYLLPMIVLFWNKQEYHRIDYMIAILLCLIMNPIQIVLNNTTFTPIIANISSIILWITLMIYSRVWKD